MYQTQWEALRNHDAHLFPALQAALATLGDRPLDFVLVGSGPGSYGGVRVALAAGVGICTVTGARLVAVESWAQLAAHGTCVVADARRGGWTVRYPDGRIEVVSPEELQALPYPVVSTEQAGKLSHLRIKQLQAEEALPDAAGIVSTWLAMSPQEQEAAACKPAEPIYVRPPHITAAVRKPWEI